MLDEIKQNLTLPVIVAPMFLVSQPALVIECCKAGIVGSFPALNQRTSAGYREWLEQIQAELGEGDAPFAVNLIVHKTNPRLAADLELTVEHKVPIVITSLGAATEVVDAVHSYGGLVLHDVITTNHAQKALAAGVDGLIAVCAGAGGHAGSYNPFAFISELRAITDKPILASGCISNGASILAAQAAGADLAYMGTRFIAAQESMASDAYRSMMINSEAKDIIYTPKVSGVNANFMMPSIEAAGLDLDSTPTPTMNAEKELNSEAKAWKDVWSAGQGVGAISAVEPVADIVQNLKREYRAALDALNTSASAYL
ncbi:nitronate monooxygenase family protein [Halioxenophilus sp. WMMB6]|uniref:NAD(P)H-dependent flavin oxidoreductase n=1 Tax=Halioxenophilus sp. WMMB6 TaxID=3073815 RepID=UPI00295E4E82|nr:nitronate monooxygenase family protein [Halioxenophilus sp. WMMB6]